MVCLYPSQYTPSGVVNGVTGTHQSAKTWAQRLQTLRFGVECIYRRPISETVECPPVTVEDSWYTGDV
jgi:hypothetical protein